MRGAAIKTSKPVLLLAVAFLLLGSAGGATAAFGPGSTRRVSISTSGMQQFDTGFPTTISADGRFVAFESFSPLVVEDTNGFEDVYVHDRQTGATERISVSSTGEQGKSNSGKPAISADGRYVVFESLANNLVSGDTNGIWDAFMHDRQTGVTERISVSGSSEQGNGASFGPSVSSDGRYVVFGSIATNLVSNDTNGVGDIFVRDRQSGTTALVSLSSNGEKGNAASYAQSLSADGRFVAFDSAATNLVSNDTNGYWDVFVRDLHSGTTERVSVSTSGVQGNGNSPANLVHFLSIASDGGFVAFASNASNLVDGDTNGNVDIFVHELLTGITRRVSVSSSAVEGNGDNFDPTLSADGRYVVFESGASNLVGDDTNGEWDIFAHDTQSNTTWRVSVTSSGEQGDDGSLHPFISANGNFVAFTSWAANLVNEDANGYGDIFIHDLQSGATDQLSIPIQGAYPGNNNSSWPSVSAGGSFVAFSSFATNLVTGDTNTREDVFIHETQTGITRRVSVSTDGVQGNGDSTYPSVSADGRFVAFASGANNLVSGDTNSTWDIFVRDLQTGITERMSVSSSGVQSNGDSTEPFISSDGRFVAFTSFGNNLVSGDTNGYGDIFVRDRQNGTTERISVSSSMVQSNAACEKSSISADGRYVTFRSVANNLVSSDTNGFWDVFVHDRQGSSTWRVSVSSSGQQGNHASQPSSISADGRYVAFESFADNLVIGDTNYTADIFIYEIQTGAVQRISLSSGGVEGNGGSSDPFISADGRFVAFKSGSNNLVSGDTNGKYDIFVHDRQSGETQRVSISNSGEQANADSEDHSSISPDGRFVAFTSGANNLVDFDTGILTDVFLHDRCPGGCFDQSVYLPLVIR